MGPRTEENGAWVREAQPRAASPAGDPCSLGVRLHSMATAFTLRRKRGSYQLDSLLKRSPRISICRVSDKVAPASRGKGAPETE